MNMHELEIEIIHFANEIIKSNIINLKKKQVVIQVYPKISGISEKYREFIFILLCEKNKDFLIIEFPTIIEGKYFCTINEAKKWILEDFEEFINRI